MLSAAKYGVEKPILVKSTPPKEGYSACDQLILEAGIVDIVSARELIRRESGCNVYAKNPTSGAYGIPQALPAHKMVTHGADWATNPITQLRWMDWYVLKSYGSWANALAFQIRNNWY